MMDVFTNMGVILLNIFGAFLYFLLVIVLAFGPGVIGFLGWMMINISVSERPRFRKHKNLWGTLAFFVGFLAALFLYSVIFTFIPIDFWILGPFLPGNAWLGGLR